MILLIVTLILCTITWLTLANEQYMSSAAIIPTVTEGDHLSRLTSQLSSAHHAVENSHSEVSTSHQQAESVSVQEQWQASNKAIVFEESEFQADHQPDTQTEILTLDGDLEEFIEELTEEVFDIDNLIPEPISFTQTAGRRPKQLPLAGLPDEAFYHIH